MAKIKLQGHASGSGIITLTAPNTSTDRTITLPDGDVTLGAATPSIVDGGNATAMTIDSSENVGIGVASPDSKLHVFNGEASITADADADDIIVENNGACGITIGSANNSTGSIRFADNSQSRTSDGRGLSQFTAKAWVNFNGSGTVAIRDSHNVSSITDRGTGQYSVNFSNALDSADYTAGGMSGNITGATGDSRSIQRDGTWTTTVCQIRVTYADGGAGAVVDDSFIGVQVFGG
jgi:hypothetical protein